MMDLIDLTDINNRLRKWREKRNIDMFQQRKGLLANILEELTEYLRADNEHDKINALCDVSIFILNSFEINEVEKRETDVFPYNFFMTIYVTRLKTRASFEFLLGHIVREFDILKYKYVPCMYETLKEIESRVGHYDDKLNKWVKETQYEKVYIPNYEQFANIKGKKIIKKFKGFRKKG